MAAEIATATETGTGPIAEAVIENARARGKDTETVARGHLTKGIEIETVIATGLETETGEDIKTIAIDGTDVETKTGNLDIVAMMIEAQGVRRLHIR